VSGLQADLLVWCGAEGYVYSLWTAAVAPRKLDIHPSAPHHTDNLKPKHQIQQAATTCIILSSS
jgi:hypothetical protein